MEYAVTGSPNVPIRAEVVAGLCQGGSCPTIYRTDRGSYLVQGYTIRPEEAGLALPDGEQLVEIPLELLAQLARDIT